MINNGELLPGGSRETEVRLGRNDTLGPHLTLVARDVAQGQPVLRAAGLDAA